MLRVRDNCGDGHTAAIHDVGTRGHYRARRNEPESQIVHTCRSVTHDDPRGEIDSGRNSSGPKYHSWLHRRDIMERMVCRGYVTEQVMCFAANLTGSHPRSLLCIQ